MILTIKYSLWRRSFQEGPDKHIQIGVKKKPQRNPHDRIPRFLSGKQVCKQAPAHIFTEVSVASEILFKVREESMLANRCAWVLFLQIGQGSSHASLIASYNSHQNPFKADYVLQRMVLVSCRYVVSFASF